MAREEALVLGPKSSVKGIRDHALPSLALNPRGLRSCGRCFFGGGGGGGKWSGNKSLCVQGGDLSRFSDDEED
jgi:hypothetical protein